MGYLIKDIKLPDNNYIFISDDENEGNVLKGLSKINIFIGENNSGKSRLLRSLLTKNFNFKTFENKNLEKINDFYSNFKKNIDNKYPKFTPKDEFEYYTIKTIIDQEIEPVRKSLDSFDHMEYLTPNKDYFEWIKSLKNMVNLFAKNKVKEEDLEGASEQDHAIYSTNQNILKIFNECLEKSDIMDVIDYELKFKFDKIYIPILRGIRPSNYIKKNEQLILDLNIDNYKIRTQNDYFEDLSEPINIWTGLEIYSRIKKYSNGSSGERRKLNQFTNFLSKNFFDNNTVELISTLNEEGEDDILSVKVGKEMQNFIYDLGDGIQSIIILTFPLFMQEGEIEENKNILVFVEEPEQLLHPGLQRKLIEIILKDEENLFDNFQFFFTTHSNHFLDITLDYKNVSIFTLRKKAEASIQEKKDDEIHPKFFIEDVSYGNTDTLELLGVRNTSVFLSNCTIWVEGITDRRYIKKYFEIYQEHLKMESQKSDKFIEFREDYHYSFVEYSGNNITHWSFLDDDNELDGKERINLERLCGKLFLITDKDGLKNNSDTPQKIKRFKKLEKKLGERYYCLNCKEIENTLSKRVIADIVKEYEQYFNAPEEYFRNIESFLDNRELDEDSYRNVNLGKYIEDKILKGKLKRKSYKDGTTIKDKKTFCNKALNCINNYEDLSSEAIKVCELLYNFIAKENRLK